MAATASAPEARTAPARATRKRTMGLWMATAFAFANLVRALPRTGGPGRSPARGTTS